MAEFKSGFRQRKTCSAVMTNRSQASPSSISTPTTFLTFLPIILLSHTETYTSCQLVCTWVVSPEMPPTVMSNPSSKATAGSVRSPSRTDSALSSSAITGMPRMLSTTSTERSLWERGRCFAVSWNCWKETIELHRQCMWLPYCLKDTYFRLLC